MTGGHLVHNSGVLSCNPNGLAPKPARDIRTRPPVFAVYFLPCALRGAVATGSRRLRNSELEVLATAASPTDDIPYLPVKTRGGGAAGAVIALDGARWSTAGGGLRDGDPLEGHQVDQFLSLSCCVPSARPRMLSAGLPSDHGGEATLTIQAALG